MNNEKNIPFHYYLYEIIKFITSKRVNFNMQLFSINILRTWPKNTHPFILVLQPDSIEIFLLITVIVKPIAGFYFPTLSVCRY